MDFKLEAFSTYHSVSLMLCMDTVRPKYPLWGTTIIGSTCCSIYTVYSQFGSVFWGGGKGDRRGHGEYCDNITTLVLNTGHCWN